MTSLFCALCVGTISLLAQESAKLTGTVIGTTNCIDYNSGLLSTKINSCANALDGDLETFFASYDRSFTWVGYDLQTPHVITKVGWSPRNDVHGEERVVLGMFQGANSEDFSDAMPIYMIKEKGTIGTISYGDVDVTKGFRYVRYVGPNDARCNIAEIEFYGFEGEGSDDKLYQLSNLPVVVINIENNAFPQDKVNDLVANINIISENGSNVLSKSGTVRLRGNASANFPKKPFRIKFDKKQQVLDAPAKAKKWTLINNYGDKTLMRNILAFEISKRLGMEYTPYCTPVDVVVNGEYQGCYQLCDQIEVNDGRVEVEEMDVTTTTGDDLTGGYLIEIDAYAYDEESWFTSSKGTPVTIKYPSDDEINVQQGIYIEKHFNKMEAAIYNISETSYKDYLDVESFVKHFIVGELSGNTDTYWSTYLYKRRGDDHFYVGPVWDFDIAFENDYRTYPINDKSDYIFRSGGSEASGMINLVNKILDKTDTQSELSKAWNDARNNGGITKEEMTDFINETAKLLSESQKLNFTRWNIMNEGVHMNPKIWGSYDKEVANVKNYLSKRIEWMDNMIGFKPNAIGNITIDESNAPVSIYNLSGVLVSNGKADNLPSGIYIVRQGNKTKKLLIK